MRGVRFVILHLFVYPPARADRLTQVLLKIVVEERVTEEALKMDVDAVIEALPFSSSEVEIILASPPYRVPSKRDMRPPRTSAISSCT